MKTIKPGQLGDPSVRVRFGKDGKMGFIHVGKGNPDAIRGQQAKLTTCARSAKGKKGVEFKNAVKSCLRK
jgi:hypothetical protein